MELRFLLQLTKVIKNRRKNKELIEIFIQIKIIDLRALFFCN